MQKRLAELEKMDKKYCEYKEERIRDFKEDVLKNESRYASEKKKLYTHLKNARKILDKKDSYLLQIEGFEQIKRRIIALENDVWSDLYLETFYKSDEGREIKKQYRIAPTNGYFLSVGIIGALELGYDYFNHKIKKSKDMVIDERAREKFYTTRYRTLQRDRFLSFDMNRREIKQFCSILLKMDNDDFNEWLELFFYLLKYPQIFNKPPYDPKYCYKIQKNGIFNGEGKVIREWDKIS